MPLRSSGTAGKPIIGVIVAGSCDGEIAAKAEAVGSLIADNGCMLVCGGLGGVMQAACRGAVNNGGDTIGIIPSDNAGDSNPWVTIPIVTDMGHARNIIIAHTSQALVAIEGEYGTLSEISISLKLDRTVVCLGGWTQIAGAQIAQTPEEAVGIVLAAIK